MISAYEIWATGCTQMIFGHFEFPVQRPHDCKDRLRTSDRHISSLINGRFVTIEAECSRRASAPVSDGCTRSVKWLAGSFSVVAVALAHGAAMPANSDPWVRRMAKAFRQPSLRCLIGPKIGTKEGQNTKHRSSNHRWLEEEPLTSRDPIRLHSNDTRELTQCQKGPEYQTRAERNPKEQSHSVEYTVPHVRTSRLATVPSR